ncbi:MAG: adenylate/guanylate cyclase domain-containing protein, partial [Chloroflexia bacterium]|nr:adenylate/guanylate cyclase domain-containing protein [Chloroflexia bacterium]
LKVGVASGSIRRFVVGDPAIQLLDTLAGSTLARAVVGEHLAQPGEVLLDAAARAAFAPSAEVGSTRLDPETGETFTVLDGLVNPPIVPPWEAINVPEDILRPWVLDVVAERYAAGLGAFLTELRPAVVLFMRFGGIAYDSDNDASQILDLLICRVQQLIVTRGGTLLQLMIGDKGSHVYALFGAPVAHENDAHRAAHAALALHAVVRDLGLPPAHIGLSQGILQVGAYGGRTRHTYGALGDEVNVAARLMSAATPGETLISARVQTSLVPAFTYEPRPPLPLKGKAEPLPVFALTGLARRRALRLQEPTYNLPMIGRESVLRQVEGLLQRVRQGQGQVVTIVGEAGIGKSRLVAEVVRLARRYGFPGYGGAGDSLETITPYLAWKPIFQACFDLDPDAPRHRQMRLLKGELQDRVPRRVDALPLLGPLLDLPLEENDFTRTLTSEERQTTLEALLLDLLEQIAGEARDGLLLVIEDVHWLDPLSVALLAVAATLASELPLFILLTYRPFAPFPAALERVMALSHTTHIELPALGHADVEGLVRTKLAQLFPARTGALPAGLVPRLLATTQGNPFFVEELLSFIHDRGINPYDPTALVSLELPDSLHRLVLARIDQLTEREQATLRVASVVGRRFLATWLPGMAPDLGDQRWVNADLDALARLELTAPDVFEQELAYLFRHIVTRDVAYESLPLAVRQRLHEQLAHWLEQQGREPLPLDVLAYHYDRSANEAKRREFLRRAGEYHLAQGNVAASVGHLARLLAVLSPDDARYATTARMVGEAYTGLGAFEQATQVLQMAEAMVRNET